MAGALEQIAYGIARGVARAWFEEMDLRKLAEREVADDPVDFDRARRFRAAVERLRLRSAEAGDPGRANPPSGGTGV